MVALALPMKRNSTKTGKLHPVAQARKDVGITLRDLAAKAGLSHVGLSHIETGRSEPKLKTMRAIEHALGDRRIEWP